ncbi:hypothetical protein HZS_3532 [Henneguya salminicola]|nr:hypothetical protein HZS_3532 [Henneguya salminicola]
MTLQIVCCFYLCSIILEIILAFISVCHYKCMFRAVFLEYVELSHYSSLPGSSNISISNKKRTSKNCPDKRIHYL